MGSIEGQLDSTLVDSDSLEVVVGLIEVASCDGCYLLLSVEHSHVHDQYINGIQSVFSRSRSGPNGVDRSAIIDHTDCTTVEFVNVQESEVGLKSTVDFANSLLKGRI
jgi:hypothetical protein